jgi:hypothetical protein
MPDATQRQWIEERTAVLQGSTNAEDLTIAATDLARSDDPRAIEALGAALRQVEFLDRLDEPDSSNRLLNLSEVFAALKATPSPEVARLCVQLVDEPIYLEHDRKSLVLEALAAVVPMAPESVAAFRRANEEGYYGYDALLLAANSSPTALELFRSMMGQRDVEVEERVELIHKGVMPHRIRLTVLQMVSAMLGDNLEEPVVTAAIESVFDYKPEWFTIHGPRPPAWRMAPNDVLRYLIELGAAVRNQAGIDATLGAAIDATTDVAHNLLNARTA